MKRCFKCGKTKRLSSFYRHPMMIDGRLGKCKDCAKRDVRENRQKRRDYYIKFDRERAMLPHRVKARKRYAKTERGKLAIATAVLNARKKYPEKYKARMLTAHAIRCGRLLRLPCEKQPCKGKAEAHHEDYSKPLDVRWLCFKHHREEHGQTVLR